MKTLILKDVGKVDFEEHERPQAVGRDIVVKISGAGICGTDLASYVRVAIGVWDMKWQALSVRLEMRVRFRWEQECLCPI